MEVAVEYGIAYYGDGLGDIVNSGLIAIRQQHGGQASPPPRDAMWTPCTGALTSSSSVAGHLYLDYQTGQAAPS